MRDRKRILIATVGSLGDLHPCLALALELKSRGHRVTIASTNFYQAKIEALGIGFHPMRPHWDPNDSKIIRQCENMRTGIEVLLRKIILPELRDTLEDLLSASSQADFLLAGELVYPAPLVAEKLGLRWASILLSPTAFFSSHDPSVFANAPGFIHLHKLGVPAYRALLELARRSVQHWWRPVRELRRELGLRVECDPLFRDKFSPHLVLALFSPSLAAPQPDWPAATVQPGFLYYDRPGRAADVSPDLAGFLATGPAPIVFTLGSTAVNNAGSFYAESAGAAHALGRRTVFLTGSNPAPVPNSRQSLSLPYAPYSEVFPYTAAIVHQGGSGTTAHAMKAGKPMLIVPYGWDQPDNGARIERLGSGLCLARGRYAARSAEQALRRLLEEPRFQETARRVSAEMSREDGVADACNSIEAAL